ncbi:MAG: hypothetical protein NWE77_01205 [Candidatus Bathyarchaeota archaeon]|nr:hypothetical protein [Candidatus Bathyarchaeota archaeon]
MTRQTCQLGDVVLKSTEALTLWQTERGIIEVSRNTLAMPLELDGQREGYIFHGRGKLLLDTIVETDEGAVGKSVEKELNRPFLMFGDTEEIQQHFVRSSEEDLTEMGYENQQEFVGKAEDLWDQFLTRKVESHRRSDRYRGSVFAFQSDDGRLDILVSRGSKLIYKTPDLVFVSKGSKAVLKSPGEVVVSKHGKSIIVKRGKSIIIQK